jgi:PKD repeat protein
LNTDEVPAAVLVRTDGTAVVTGPGGPNLPGGFIPGVAAGYGKDGTLLWEAFSRLATVWATLLPSGDVCATGGYDAMVTCWQVPGGASNKPPTAVVSATPSTGAAPLSVAFSSAGSSDTDGSIASYSWNFGDGASSTAPNPTHTYTSAGTWTATLTVTDDRGATAGASATVTVTPAITKTLRSTAITLSAKRSGSRVTVSGQVAVRDAANAAVSGVNVSIAWRKPDGTSATQSALTDSSGSASFSVSGGRGSYTLTVTNLARSGYTFDAAGSLLTGSISVTK